MESYTIKPSNILYYGTTFNLCKGDIYSHCVSVMVPMVPQIQLYYDIKMINDLSCMQLIFRWMIFPHVRSQYISLHKVIKNMFYLKNNQDADPKSSTNPASSTTLVLERASLGVLIIIHFSLWFHRQTCPFLIGVIQFVMKNLYNMATTIFRLKSSVIMNLVLYTNSHRSYGRIYILL